MPPVLELRDVRKGYVRGDETIPVLRGVSLAVEPGERVVLTGRSGSGKSTMLHLMGLMDAPDAGLVLHGGEDLSRASETVRAEARLRRIGFVFQHYYLVPTLSAARNVALPLKAAEVPASRRAERVTELFEAMGLTERADHFPHELSGGQQQMVAVARALANSPPLLLADEPTGELDPESGRRVVDLLARASEEGTAVVMVTHAPELSPPRARRLRLADGQLVEGAA